jgi:2-polyprenyl-6-methoxyphenol hydroxylase-like FAD-dependent oxidoreductase
VADAYDVVVVGSGSAGSTAAIAAGRMGARTLLIDRMGFLGGISTAVLDTFYAFYTPGATPRRVVGGIAWEVATLLAAEGAAFERPNTYGAGTGITYDPEVLKRTWETLALQAGVEVLLHTWVTGVELDGERRVRALRLFNKGGASMVEANVVVDASGDADVAAWSGVSFDDPAANGQVQSLSTVFRMAGVDVQRAEAFGKDALWASMRDASASGAYRLPRIEGSWHRTPQPGVIMALMTRVPRVDATDPVQLTAAEIEGRRQAWEYARFLRERVPGFERAVMVSTSPAIGVRESRRVHGRYRLTAEDVLAGRRFDDEIALCGAPIEDHHAGADTRWRYVPDGGVYGLPYRCLLPQGVEGLLVAGRCFSATHDAHASARSMGTCMTMGQAAGTAAALAASGSNVPGDLSATRLRAQLAEHGVLLEPLPAAEGRGAGPLAAEAG